ncbi:hypothetical protein P9477_23245 [Enterobacter mori]|uniref:hypothetical protein n=1 Tax=Enterobacter mori TaxID=539813 RepID=UPI00398B00EC
MGLFGSGGGSTTSKMTRPDYIQNMINNLNGQIKGANVGDYTNMQYAGLNSDQQSALNNMLNNPEMQGYANDLLNAGNEGLNNLNDVYKQITDLYGSNNYSSSSLDNLVSQFYNRGDVENAINAQNSQSENRFAKDTQTNVAQQMNNSGGFGSAQRLGQDRAKEALVSEEQQNASDISNQAYSNAVSQAQSVLASNDANKRAALGALTTNAQNQAGLINSGAQLQQDLYNQSAAASSQMLNDNQAKLNNDYTNQQNAQNMPYQDIQNRINAASVLNGALGQTTTTKTSGGGAGILGGAMSGAAAGSAFGPWGALAGAVIGGAASA